MKRIWGKKKKKRTKPKKPKRQQQNKIETKPKKKI